MNGERMLDYLSLRNMYRAALASILLGGLAATAVGSGAAEGTWQDGVTWTIYMLAVGSVAGIVGIIFGVPRARAEFSPEASERYSANSNLEQISDWLTKLLVGAGLVELKNLPGALVSAGEFLGEGLTVGNPTAYATSAVIYGMGIGFGIGYLWARLRLRLLLEVSDRDAAEASRKRELIVRQLRQATTDKGGASTERESSLRSAADQALQTVRGTDPSERGAILWVDDHPENNLSITQALAELKIRVDTVLSTDEAIRRLTSTYYALVISDLGRTEDGTENPMAGNDLILAMRAQGIETPVIIYAGLRGWQNRATLEASGAMLVTRRPSEVFSEAVRVVTGQDPTH